MPRGAGSSPVKTGKVKLVWNGPKPTAPSQLVIRGSGDFQAAFFDVAGGKEVEVPAGQYRVVMELTDQDAAGAYATFPFTKGTTPATTNPTATAQFHDLVLDLH